MKSTTFLTTLLVAGAMATPAARPPNSIEVQEVPSETASASTDANAAAPTVASSTDKLANFRHPHRRPPPFITPDEHMPSVPGKRSIQAGDDGDSAAEAAAREAAHGKHDRLMIATAGRLVAEDKMSRADFVALDLADADAVFAAVSTRLDRLPGAEIKRLFTEALVQVEANDAKQETADITALLAAVPERPEGEEEDGEVLETSADTPSGLPPLSPWVDNPSLLTNGQPAEIYRGPSIPKNVEIPPVKRKGGRVGPISATVGKQDRWYY